MRGGAQCKVERKLTQMYSVGKCAHLDSIIQSITFEKEAQFQRWSARVDKLGVGTRHVRPEPAAETTFRELR